MPRLFTGLEIPSDVAFELDLLRGGIGGARWIDRENFHITLRFIGDIDDGLAREIAYELDGVEARPFTLRLKGIGAFGGPARSCPGVIALFGAGLRSLTPQNGARPAAIFVRTGIALAGIRSGALP